MPTIHEDYLADRVEMPVFDESIFEPRKGLHKLGLTDEDIQDLVDFLKWCQAAQEKASVTPRALLLQALRARQKKLADQKRLELLDELKRLERL